MRSRQRPSPARLNNRNEDVGHHAQVVDPGPDASVGAVHHHRTWAEEQRRSPIEQCYRVMTYEAIRASDTCFDVAGQRCEDQQTHRHEPQVAEGVDGLAQQAAAYAFAPARYLADGCSFEAGHPNLQDPTTEGDDEDRKRAKRDPRGVRRLRTPVISLRLMDVDSWKLRDDVAYESSMASRSSSSGMAPLSLNEFHPDADIGHH